MKAFIRMKYEQFLMRLFDFVLWLFSKSEVYWYPEHVLFDKKMDLEHKIYELENKNDRLLMLLLDRDEEIDKLETALEFYEPVPDVDDDYCDC